MSIPLYFPPVHYVPKLELQAPVTIRDLCGLAGVRCRATGKWTERRVEMRYGPVFKMVAEPGDWGKVRVELPYTDRLNQARLALAAMAFGMHDIVAKESIRAAAWLRLRPPRGRPRSGCALSLKERQKRFRERRKQKLRQLT